MAIYIICICFVRYQENSSPPENCPPENRKLPPRKLLPRKLTPMKIPPMNIPPYESFPMWKLTPRNLRPRKLPTVKITPNEIPSPLINYINERKNKIIDFFVLKKAVQYSILIKITKVLFDIQMISQIVLGLDTFYTEWKNSKYRTKVKIAKWHLLASCTSQGELKLGSQIIKFGKCMKLLNSQLSLPITLWIFEKANSKMHALGRSVAIVYECGRVLVAHISIMYTW